MPVEALDGFAPFVRHLNVINSDLTSTFFPQASDIDDLKQFDTEGRIVITDHSLFVLLNLYCPHETSCERLPFKMAFYHALEKITKLLNQMGRQVVIAGDMNIAHYEIDHCDPKKSIKESQVESFSDTEPRRWLTKFLYETNMVDTFRHFYSDKTASFSHWDIFLNARPANFGSRIDYIFTSPSLVPLLKDASIDSTVLGSDHCPVSLEFKEPILDLVVAAKIQFVLPPAKSLPPKLCAKYMDAFSGRQKTIQQFFRVKIDADADDKKPASSTAPRPTQRKMTDFMTSKKVKSDVIEILDDSSPSKADEELVNEPHKEVEEDKALTTKKSATTWLGKPRSAPLCYHDEPAKEFTVNKKGQNQGRQFYVCKRPMGGTSAEIKSGNTEFKCDYFEWKNGGSSSNIKRPFDNVE